MNLNFLQLFQSLGLALLVFFYLFLTSRRVIAFVRHRRFVDLFTIVVLKGSPFLLLVLLIHKNSSVFDLIWLTLGITLGFGLFFIWFARAWSKL